MLLARSIQGRVLHVNEQFHQASYAMKHGTVEAVVILTTSTMS